MANHRERIAAQVFDEGKLVSTIDVSEWTFRDLEVWTQDVEDSGLQVIVRRCVIPVGRPVEGRTP